MIPRRDGPAIIILCLIPVVLQVLAHWSHTAMDAWISWVGYGVFLLLSLRLGWSHTILLNENRTQQLLMAPRGVRLALEREVAQRKAHLGWFLGASLCAKVVTLIVTGRAGTLLCWEVTTHLAMLVFMVIVFYDEPVLFGALFNPLIKRGTSEEFMQQLRSKGKQWVFVSLLQLPLFTFFLSYVGVFEWVWGNAITEDYQSIIGVPLIAFICLMGFFHKKIDPDEAWGETN